MELLVSLAALIAAFAVVVLYRHGDRKLAAGAISVLAVGVLLAVALPSNSARASDPIALLVTPIANGASDRLDLEGETYEDAKAALEAVAEPGGGSSVTIPVPVAGLPPLSSSSAILLSDDSSFSLSIHGEMDMFGTTGELWLVATWEDDESTDPVINTFIKFASIDLADLNPGWPADFPVTLGPAIIGITDTANLLEENGDIETDLLLDDGLASVANEFDLQPGKLNFQATVATGPLLEAAESIGGTGGVKLTGALGTSLSLVDEDEPSPTTVGMDLKAEFEIVTPSGFPEWVELTSPWTLEISADSGGAFFAQFTGGAIVRPDGETEIEVTGSVAVEYANPDLTISMSLEVGSVPNLFGQSWLDLNGAEVHASINATTGAFSGGLSANVTIGPAIAALSIDLSVDAGTTSAVVDASLTPVDPAEGILASEVMAAMGAPVNTVNPSLIDVQLNEVSFHLEIVSPPSPDPMTVVVSLFADAEIIINQATIPVQMLFRVSKGADPIDFLVAAAIEGPNLSDLVPGIPFDWDLPDLAIIASNAPREDNSGDLDPPTFSYFAPMYCEEEEITDETCEFDLEVKQGIQISALIELPQDLVDQLASLSIAVDGPLQIVGVLPVFGGTELSLEVILPETTVEDEGIVESAQVSFFIRKVGTEFTAGISGEMGFRIKRSDAAACENLPEPDGDLAGGECYDVVKLEVTAQISSNVDGISIELLGTVSKWDNAFGEPWLDIQTFTLKLGISIGAGGGVSLDLGLLGQLKFGVAPNTKDLTLAIKVSITPTPPWIILKGFTIASYDGIGIRDIARLVGVDSSAVPDVSLKNLWLSFGVEADVDLCIRQGFYLSAELHINAPSSTGADPACTPPAAPDPGEEDPEDDSPIALPKGPCSLSATCVAAILIDVNTTPGPEFGFLGRAELAAFDLGPVHIDETIIELKVTTQEQHFLFSGGGRLDDPTGATDDTWAEGSLTIYFSNNGGLINVYIHGFVELAGGYLLSAEITASFTADFSLITSANGFLQFLTTLEFSMTVTITSEAFDDFVDALEDAGETLVSFVDDTAVELEGAYDDVVDFFNGEYCVGVFDATSCNASDNVIASTGDARAYLNTRVANARADILDEECPLGICVTHSTPLDSVTVDGVEVCSESGLFFDTCNQYYANVIETRIRNHWDFNGGDEYITIHGIHSQAWDGGGLFNSITMNFLGQCETYTPPGVNQTTQTGDLVGTIACNGGATDYDVVRYAVGPILVQNFPDETGGYTLTFGQNGVDAVTTLDNALSPGTSQPMSRGQSIEGQSTETPTFQPECGSTTINYVSNTIAPYAMEFSHPGPGESSATVNTDANGFLIPSQAVQGVVTTLTTDGQEVECLANQLAPNYGNTTVINPGNTFEGTPITLTGFANDGAETPVALAGASVVIDWGDGSAPETVTAGSTGLWTATHTYVDDPGAGPTSLYPVSVNANAAAQARLIEIVVENSAPDLTGIGFAPVSPFVGDSVTTTFSFTDLGVLDSKQLVVDWGDGTPVTVLPVTAALTSAVLNHSYTAALAIGEKARDYTVTATLTDKDGGVDAFEQDITVQAVLPPESQITLKNSNGSTYAPGTWTKFDVAVSIATSGSAHPPVSTSYGVDNIPCGQSWPLGDFCTNYLAPFSITTDGAHTLTVYSRDARGTEYPVFIPVKIDKTAPQVVVQLPGLPLNQAGFFNKGQAPVQVAVIANDISGVDQLSCTVNGNAAVLEGVSGLGSTSVTATLPVSVQGAVTVACVATNSAAVSGTSADSAATKTFNVDSTNPVVDVTGVTNGGSYAQGSFTPGCSTTDAHSGVLTNATLSTTGGNGSGAGSVTATCAGAKDKAGNVSPAVSSTFSVTCATSLSYRGVVNVKQGTIVHKPTVTVTLAINSSTCAVTGVTITPAVNVPGAIQVATATNWKPPVSSVANQWLFTMKTQNATTGGVYINNAFRALDGTGSLTVKLLNDRAQLYLKLTGQAPIGVGTTKVSIEAEASSMSRLP